MRKFFSWILVEYYMKKMRKNKEKSPEVEDYWMIWSDDVIVLQADMTSALCFSGIVHPILYIYPFNITQASWWINLSSQSVFV